MLQSRCIDCNKNPTPVSIDEIWNIFYKILEHLGIKYDNILMDWKYPVGEGLLEISGSPLLFMETLSITFIL